MGLLLCYYSVFVEPNKLEITNYTIQDESLQGIKIVFASDFHIKLNQQKRLGKIVDFKLYPMEEVVEVSNNDHIKGGIIGFLLGDWVGALIGSFIGAMSQHKTIDVYNLALITDSESVCFQIKE